MWYKIHYYSSQKVQRIGYSDQSAIPYHHTKATKSQPTKQLLLVKREKALDKVHYNLTTAGLTTTERTPEGSDGQPAGRTTLDL